MVDQVNLDDGLDALEPILPGHDQPQRCPVLRQELLAVQADRHQRKVVHRLVQPQPLDVGPLEPLAALERELDRVNQGLEPHVLRAALRLDRLQQLAQREAEPGDDHRPGLDATEAVDAFLRGELADEILDAIRAGPVDQPAHFHSPGRGLEMGAEERRVALVQAELIEVVVGRDCLMRGERIAQLVRVPAGLRFSSGRGQQRCRNGWRGCIGERFSGDGWRGCGRGRRKRGPTGGQRQRARRQPDPAHELPPVQVDVLRRDF